MPSMKKALLISTLLCSTGLAQADVNINALFGSRSVDDDRWAEQAPTDIQRNELDSRVGTIGLMVDFPVNSWPVNVAVNGFFSGDSKKIDGKEVIGAVAELQLGLRKYWQTSGSPWRPYVNGGLTHATVVREQLASGGHVEEKDDAAVGVWFGGGLQWQATQRISLGLDLRYSHAGDVTLDNTELKTQGLQSGFSVGYTF